MIRRILIISLLLISVSVTAFEIGRTTGASARPVPAPAVTEPEGTGSQPSTEEVSQPERVDLRDIVSMPFNDTYDLLKSGSPETLHRWVIDLERISVRPARW